ncbi:hypothetical protein NZD89_10705 [Alicyclobacillus fastidiosus]|uniref:FtsK domain-containing protein n=1 Tax=Alicyclobacillus fastidiosus TaxID=392011 RepID=A0ABY6ZLM0_9BACL|nr:hypothetical protein [Alicyclobacillus fastidiosus]WAH43808.1 hypothetical protein NZD89_10705 [Alicyclobacillus fastidiosus]GMA60036.1 hypothetical protein GCM10025859_04760 [Alicyclobacillus fastidiosus]
MYSDIEQSIVVLEQIVDEMKQRMIAIGKARSQFKPIPKYPRILVFVDEGGEIFSLAELLGADVKKRVTSLLSSIARLGRERCSLLYLPNVQTKARYDPGTWPNGRDDGYVFPAGHGRPFVRRFTATRSGSVV